MMSGDEIEGDAMKRNQEFFRGCLIGGAIGDALGWPVPEFTAAKRNHAGNP